MIDLHCRSFKILFTEIGKFCAKTRYIKILLNLCLAYNLPFSLRTHWEAKLETVKQSLNALQFQEIGRSAALPVGVLVLMAMMILPLPSYLLDTFFISNIVISLLVLMVAVNTNRPLDFSSFPNLLLIATVLRLALNVASTRIVLSQGHEGSDAAGLVIKAFGEFVVAGNYTVGIFVFVILVIINLVVITKGAGRVSEVSARFTLDAMPGKQMAIDADLNAGLLSPEDATERRAEIAAEADFYGSMDGASKFVKGDAIAGILILVINIVGGLIIGIAQHDLALSDAAQTYIILSIGDGLVAQVPSLLLSIATAIIVTRVSSNHIMSEQIGGQLGISRAWYPAAAVIVFLGLVPGMPNLLFGVFAVATLTIAFLLQRREESLQRLEENQELSNVETPKIANQIGIDDITDHSKISLLLGYKLIELVQDEATSKLLNRITSIRKEISTSMGFVIPGVRVRDELELSPNNYQIKLGQTIVAEDVIYPTRKLAIPGDRSKTKLSGIEVKDPTFGIDAVWIEEAIVAEAQADDYAIIEPDAVLATHISQVIKKYAFELLGQDDVQQLVDNLSETNPNLVDATVPKLVNLNILTAVLKNLLTERVPISDLRKILEKLSTVNVQNVSPLDLAEILRADLSRLILQQVVEVSAMVPIMLFTPDLERILMQAVQQHGSDNLIIDGDLAKSIQREINQQSEKMSASNQPSILVVAPQIRRPISMFFRPSMPDLIVLSFSELPNDRNVEVIHTIGKQDVLTTD